MHEKGGVMDVRVMERDIDESSAIRHPGLKPGRHLCWTVRDSGCGMAPETLGRIFEPFFTTRAQGEGTGLGLSVVYGIVTDAGGRIGVTSEVGVGTSFEILLPLCASPGKLERAAEGCTSFAGRRVLLVDADPALTEVGKATLAPLGHEVTAFTNPAEAMAAFGQHPDQFDVLVTEILMPTMTGKALALAVRRIRADLPVILTSGAAPCVGEEEWRAAGVTSCLQKPYRPTELAQAIQDACGKRSFTTSRS
jgi:CheY-like chemotaxis protein